MTRLGAHTALAIAALLALAGCARGPLGSVPVSERAAIETRLMRDIAVLASDEFGGRRPGTLGEERTVAYITQEMQAAGLVSGTNDPGSPWRAAVELVSSEPATSRIVLRRGRREFDLTAETSAAFTSSRRALVEAADMVFVGRLGYEAPDELITGKVVVMLGEPGSSPARRRNLFDKNPAAIITVVDNAEAIASTRQAFGSERFLLASEEEPRLSAFVTRAAMAQALKPEVWNELLQLAETEEFTPQPIALASTIEATSVRREFTSYNVLGLHRGQVPQSGAVLLLAHWDHLGECGEAAAQDRLCNGAVDNASGIAVMLELARRLAAGGPHDRDIYVLATSAEEAGLLGARAFIADPPVPLDSIVAAFNFDTVALAPAGSPVGFVGEGRTPLDEVILQTMAEGKRSLGNREFAETFVQRQDGWALLEQGVPAVMLSTAFGSEIVLGPFLERDYHRPSDEIGAIELGGAIDDLLLHEALVRRIADTKTFPGGGG
ncbi:M20/M25/M40 family metallo-hydrolase [Erythrobacter sp. JK5]|uniref:M20/M25/M40 family metallo-hydrolase n=1 Tax=Erythrobacter sp. JK5 TaxID=2829500 RepID=UPI001BADAD80|nr:M20/M25/M40 family metallo-hydrolase [Erythrobacter sp. JK5]QUL38555.1 M20/M25/M40 family metallo-hydrolase [Erythrobacter sp. JK5]